MNEIYVVIGSTGEYSDRSEWLVRAFTSSSRAEDFVIKCEEQGRLLELARKNDEVEKYGDIPAEYLKYDPEMRCDYIGVHYYAQKVWLELGRLA